MMKLPKLKGLTPEPRSVKSYPPTALTAGKGTADQTIIFFLQ
jgi:hypothetical protein